MTIWELVEIANWIVVFGIYGGLFIAMIAVFREYRYVRSVHTERLHPQSTSVSSAISPPHKGQVNGVSIS